MSNNKRIAKNTLFLYFRMILVMGVSLYTSRIVLKELGISDYGIYSLVGGFIAMFRFLDASMSAAAQRYLSFDIGENDEKRLAKTFSALLTITIGIAILVLILAETFGLWYINYKMIYPPGRFLAVNVVFQLSVVATLIGIIQVPYNALLIARERMNVYAYVSIAEASLKLIAVLLLMYWGTDKLVAYAILVLTTTIIIQALYQGYCRIHYKESKYKFEKDKTYYKELVSYSGWNLFGSLSTVAKREGNNVVLNLFFGTLINAAYGIMNVVVTSINSFVTNFQIASNPQIIKLYASGDYKDMQQLVNQTAKFSFYLSLLFMAPAFTNIDYILHLWLVNPPAYSSIFIRLALIFTLIDTISGPLMTGITATGKIKVYQIMIGFLNILNLPLSYFSLKYKIFDKPETVLWIWIAISILSLFFRLYFFRILLNGKYEIKSFYIKVLLRISIVCLFSVIAGYYISRYLFVDSIGSFVVQTCIYCFLIMLFIVFLGIEKNERILILNLKNKLIKRH